MDNAIGCVGIVPKVDSVGLVSHYSDPRPNAILAAISHLSFGDTLLLEAQVYLNGTRQFGPIEAYDAEFEAIRLATALGIVVVEAGGNGALDMDTYRTLAGKAILHRDPANPDFRDSGAIMVSAATSAAPHSRMLSAPYGKRIDCYAWGENINTLAGDRAGTTNLYSTNFSGTSGASGIIAGAALAVQGRAQEVLFGRRYGPGQIRAILANPAYGTPRAATETTRIGVMPDLRKIYESVFNTAPDIYIRDFVGDVGDPHTVAASASPDIILRPDAVADPQHDFGAGSGMEDSMTLSMPAEHGQDNFIYVRVRNRGGTPATDVKATVYWSPVATLVTPDLWHLVGTATLPSVPIADELTVSPGIVWDRSAIPPEGGHYCFVGLVGNAADPAPSPADFLVWDNFVRYVQENGNVAWRNFTVVDRRPDTEDAATPAGFKALPFLMPGAPDKARDMTLQVELGLPDGAEALLEVPLVLYEWLVRSQQAGQADIDKERQVARIPVNAHGRTRFADFPLPARSRSAMRILVRIPDQESDKRYQVAARQIWGQTEVGRVTWLLRRPEQPADGASPAGREATGHAGR